MAKEEKEKKNLICGPRTVFCLFDVAHWKQCQNKQTDDSAANSINGNETVAYSSSVTRGSHCTEMVDVNSSCKATPEQNEQPLNLSDSPPATEYHSENHSTNGRSKYKSLLLPDVKMEPKENGSKVPALDTLKSLFLARDFADFKEGVGH
ncbi:UNVERIFIED_CONTAM: hypothetical protein FKN15_069862 [Acipenser sinensis]